MRRFANLFSYKLIILFINTASGILITRNSNFEIRAGISTISAWLTFSLVIFNQSHFEKILQKQKILTHRDWLIRALPFFILSFLATASLKGNYWIFPIALFYMFMNTLVQFLGAQIFLSYGTIFFLKLNLIFYLINLSQVAALVLLHNLDVTTWLLASLFSDVILFTLYKIFSRGKKIGTRDKKGSFGKKFSSAAVAATLVDSILIIIANQIAGAKELSFFVVAISCVSPLIIMYNAVQNQLLADPKKVLRQISELNFFLTASLLVTFTVVYYFCIVFGVRRIFGNNYSSLSDSAAYIICLGYLLLLFKFCNTLLRGLNLNSKSLFLSLTLISLFTLLCLTLPQSDERLILAATFSLFLALLIPGIMNFWHRYNWISSIWRR
jgi:hypothetical protein